jgi:steroid delta-isomerase-like uncharacterized protein
MTTSTPASDQPAPALDHLSEDLRELSARWLPHAGELHGLLERWGQAWNAHDLDALEALVTEDIVWEDPAMHGETVHGRSELRAFTEIFFNAFPDVQLHENGPLYFAGDPTTLALPWRMTGTFTGKLAIWGKQFGAEPPTIPPTGNSFEIEGIDLYKHRDGQLSHWTIVYDLMGLSQQLGIFS